MLDKMKICFLSLMPLALFITFPIGFFCEGQMAKGFLSLSIVWVVFGSISWIIYLIDKNLR